MDQDARGASPAWAELPADALRQIAGRLHDAGDFVRLGTVCRPWHEALQPSPAPTFLPWLVASYDSIDDPRVLLHLPFSPRKTRHLLPLSAIRGTTIQGSDAYSGRVLAVGYSNEGRAVALINPLDGDAISLPPLPQSSSRGDKWRSASGVVSSNGVVVFHTILNDDLAAIKLRSGEPAGWEEVDVSCPVAVNTTWLNEDRRRATALWSSAVLPAVACGIATLPPQPHGSDRYMLEFRGELLCVDVVMRPYRCQVAPKSVSVQVHAMQVEDDGRHRWVERENGDTDHLCFFLGSKSSFAIDAREFAGSAEVTGGCAYFFSWQDEFMERKLVYKYSFQSGTATVVDELRTLIIPIWFMPRPRISPLLPRVQ